MDQKLNLMQKGQIAEIKDEMEKLEIEIKNEIGVVNMALFVTDGIESIEDENALVAMNRIVKGKKNYLKLKANLKVLEG